MCTGGCKRESSELVTTGRTVLYGIGVDGRGEVVWRPAVVVNAWEGTHPNLQVLLDFTNDISYKLDHPEEVACPSREECERGIAWRTSVPRGTDVGCWKWPEGK